MEKEAQARTSNVAIMFVTDDDAKRLIPAHRMTSLATVTQLNGIFPRNYKTRVDCNGLACLSVRNKQQTGEKERKRKEKRKSRKKKRASEKG